MARALVVFHDEGFHVFSPLLEPGYKHCAVIVEQGDYWILFDPQAGLPHIEVIAGIEYDLVSHIQNFKGRTVIETSTRELKAEGPLLLNNCVGLVKKILGITNPLILTPYQLWEYLK